MIHYRISCVSCSPDVQPAKAITKKSPEPPGRFRRKFSLQGQDSVIDPPNNPRSVIGRSCSQSGRISMPQAVIQKTLGVHDGLAQGAAEAKPCGNGCGQSAAGSMIVGRSHGGLAQGQQRLVRHGQPVCILVIGLSEVSALDQNGTGPHPQQQTSRRVDVFLRFDGHAGSAVPLPACWASEDPPAATCDI